MTPPPPTILIADDEPSMRRTLTDLLHEEGFSLIEAQDGEQALRLVRTLAPSLVLLDINLPGVDGLSALKQIREGDPDAVVIVFTAYGTSERAIEAMEKGAYDYIEKPFELDEFLHAVRRAARHSELLGEVRRLRTGASGAALAPPDVPLIGASGSMQEIFKLIGRVARTDATVLIQGESGTGKELVADAIQRHSLRKDKAFIKVNCGALPETLLESEMFGHEKGAFTGAVAQRQGRFELADGGTIFLDEVNNMPPALQMKLLRVLQQRTFERVGGKETLAVDARVIAATNKDLEAEMKAGRFREDLYYRLNVIHIQVPPLRSHPEDIPLLAEHFLKKHSPGRSVVLAPTVLQLLQAYGWPGNVRELENVVQRSLVVSQGNVVTPEHLPLQFQGASPAVSGMMTWKEGTSLKAVLAAVERESVVRALEQAEWNRTKAAALLRINRRQLFAKIKGHRISPPRSPRPPRSRR